MALLSFGKRYNSLRAFFFTKASEGDVNLLHVRSAGFCFCSTCVLLLLPTDLGPSPHSFSFQCCVFDLLYWKGWSLSYLRVYPLALSCLRLNLNLTHTIHHIFKEAVTQRLIIFYVWSFVCICRSSALY